MPGGDPQFKTIGRPGDVMTRGATGWGPRSLAALLLALTFSVKDSLFRIVGNLNPTKMLGFEVDTQGAGFTTIIDVGAQTGSWSAALPVMPSSSVFAMSAVTMTSGGIPYITTNGLLAYSARLKWSDAGQALTAGDGIVSGGSLRVDAAAASLKSINLYTASVLRWQFGSNATAEGGADAGSNFVLTAFTDAGATIDSPITIARVAGGLITIVRPLTTSGNITQTGATTLNTGTGGVGIFGDTTIASGKNLTIGVTGASSTLELVSGQNKNAICARATSAGTKGGLYANGTQIYVAENIDWSAGAENYARASIPAWRCGNPTGNGSYAFFIDVAAAGTAGTPITFVSAAKVGTAGDFLSLKGRGAGIAITVTAASTTTLAAGSAEIQTFTGSTAGKVIQFPLANINGAGIAVLYTVNNQSSVTITPTRAGSDTFQGGGTTDPVLAGASQSYKSDGVSVWLKA